MTSAPQQPPAGWYPDPAGSGGERYWDGIAWSQATRDWPTPTATDHNPVGGSQTYGSPQGGYARPIGAQATQGQPAGFWWRLLGYVIDTILVSIVGSILSSATGLSTQVQGELDRWARELLLWSEAPTGDMPMPADAFWSAMLYSTLISIIVYAAYRTILLGTLSATLGQQAVGLRTVKVGEPADSKLGWGTAAVRGIVGALLYESIGFINGIFAAFTPRKQTLSDMISKTQVLKIR